MDPVLGDYLRSVADARDPEVLSLFAAILNKLKSTVTNEVPRIMEAVFECTLSMITQNMEDYPVHRIKFFLLLQAINTHCFAAFFNIPSHQMKLVVDAIVWAVKHTERTISETGLNILLGLLSNVMGTAAAGGFFLAYYLNIVQDVFVVLTDTLHKSGAYVCVRDCVCVCVLSVVRETVVLRGCVCFFAFCDFFFVFLFLFDRGGW